MANGSCCCGGEQSAGASQSCGCGNTCITKQKYYEGYIKTGESIIPRVATKLTFADTFGSWKARWGVNRMDYKVEPGLYGVGNPDSNTPVLVTANYKMTFDRLRSELADLKAWILVLDTKGINVWCAAGKGTFGTDELVERIDAVKLQNVVSHRKLIVPQLGAAGVSAHEVLKHSGFQVVYGPVRAKDIKSFLDSGMQVTPEMRRVNFTTKDRLILTPIELVSSIPARIVLFGVLFMLNAIGFGHYGFADMIGWLGAIFTGAVLIPVLLPWVPGRALSFKGFFLGLLWAVGAAFLFGWFQANLFKAIAYLLLLPAVTAFISMNFTGATTYTSLSGVDKEMKVALPAMVLAGICGVILLVVQDIVTLTA